MTDSAPGRADIGPDRDGDASDRNNDAPDHAGGPLITVLGEALIDLVPHGGPGGYQARPGGSPLNVAVGLARLGHRTALMARLADNAFGRQLQAYAHGEGLDLTRAPHAAEPTTLAVLSLDEHARASYDFYLDGTADWQWTAAESAAVPPDTAVLHLGSLASWTEPGAQHVHAAAAARHAQDRVLISYDPNVRPGLLGNPRRARSLIERFVRIAHIVKASNEDLAWLYPDTPPDDIAARWLSLGPALVVVTDGPHGATLHHRPLHDGSPRDPSYREGSPHDSALPRTSTPTSTPTAIRVHRPGRAVEVADTVGAGDAFTAGLLSGLIRRGIHSPALLRAAATAPLVAAIDDAVLVSALTCQRIGADPPYAAADLDADTARPLTPADLTFARPRRSTPARL